MNEEKVIEIINDLQNYNLELTEKHQSVSANMKLLMENHQKIVAAEEKIVEICESLEVLKPILNKVFLGKDFSEREEIAKAIKIIDKITKPQISKPRAKQIAKKISTSRVAKKK